MRLLVTLAPFVVLAACGARTPLEMGATGSGAEGGSPPSTLPCAGIGAAGAIAWQTTLGDASVKFEGPLAADDRGATYYLGMSVSDPSSYALVALDSCGHIVWRRNAISGGSDLNAPRSVLVS